MPSFNQETQLTILKSKTQKTQKTPILQSWKQFILQKNIRQSLFILLEYPEVQDVVKALQPNNCVQHQMLMQYTKTGFMTRKRYIKNQMEIGKNTKVLNGKITKNIYLMKSKKKKKLEDILLLKVVNYIEKNGQMKFLIQSFLLIWMRFLCM
ncbi:hypothetical protein IMG5_179170 [Ichthyophthirius multifiliis]|uniref:Uncharacterized protein n=1 Tax=Ichthyophthirius multifiliis TaxID=5932 RepID=G0R2K6_ICHMU|nr:hypothetical protein IMG5_179170 [Ichthyophthirius multifiliis]EGR28297.1 hypothetical protein IMG5_179170 [Ichthyophthirius multifiliis]|eukprot:XP_004027642.1 hypothetical protein IMG5_179170 [Ichthyophthirius multifiliis]